MPTFSPARWAALVAAGALTLAACGEDGPSVTLTAPADGAEVAGGVPVQMTADDLTIEEAGEVHDRAGHFHVTADAGCTDPGDPIAKDVDHVHFGKGQSEGVIYLGPGSHELCLQAGDGLHTALEGTDEVRVDVGIRDREDWCAVVGEVDELFTSADSGDVDFAARQIAYQGANRLIEQLVAGLDQVDADARDGVAQILEAGAQLTAVVIDAADEADATARLEARYGARGLPTDDDAARWVQDECGVDIDG